MVEEKLIEMVRMNAALYDTRNPNYLKTKLKNMIWEDIAKELKFKDGEDAKVTWLKLRASYRDARRRQQRCVKNGTPSGTIRLWRYQRQMSFLEMCLIKGPPEDYLHDEHDYSQLKLETPQETCASDEIEENSSNENDRLGLSQNTDQSDNETESYSTNNRLRKQNNLQNLLTSLVQQRADERKSFFDANKNADDSLYNFFISMYQATKKLPPNYQHKIRSQLFQAVSKAEEEIMDISSRPLSAFACSHDSAASYAHIPEHPLAQNLSHTQQATEFHCSTVEQETGNQEEKPTATLSNFISNFKGH